MQPGAVKKQLIFAAVSCIALTLLWGVLLSVAVNRSLEELQKRQDIEILPSGQREGASPPQPF
jgi:hypothetical protein